MGALRDVMMRPLVVQRHRENMTKTQLLLDMLALSPEEQNEPPKGRITINLEWEDGPLGDPALQNAAADEHGRNLGRNLNLANN